jgi:hypothetical protein
MAMTLPLSRLRLTQAKFFGRFYSSGGGTVTTVDGGNGILATPSPITIAGQLDLGPLTSDWAAGPYSISSRNSVNVRNVLEYVTGGTGTALDPWTSASGTAGIQEAYNDLPTGLGEVYAPAGWYLITEPINFSVNVAATGIGSSSAAGAVIFRGDGSGNTILLGATKGQGGWAATFGPVFDCTGAGHVQLWDFAISTKNVVLNQSSIGIYFARSTAAFSAYTQNNEVRNVYMEMWHDATANGGVGTVGIYGRAVETSYFINNTVLADYPYVFTSQDVFGIVSPNQPVNNTHLFCTQNSIWGGYANGYYAVALLQGNVQNYTFYDIAIGQHPTGTGTHAFKVLADSATPTQPIYGLNIAAIQVEGPWTGVLSTTAPLHGMRLGASYSQDTVGTNPGILLSGVNAKLNHCEINLTNSNAVTVQKMIGDGGALTGGVNSCVIHLPSPLTINAPFTAGAGNTIYANTTNPSITFTSPGDPTQLVIGPGNVWLGSKPAATNSKFTVSKNTAAAQAGFAGTVGHFVGADAANPTILLDSFGGTGPEFAGRAAQGSALGPSDTGIADTLLRLSAYGYENGTYHNQSSIYSYAAEAWTGAAKGTGWILTGTFVGSTLGAEWARFVGGGLGIGTVPPAGSPSTTRLTLAHSDANSQAIYGLQCTVTGTDTSAFMRHGATFTTIQNQAGLQNGKVRAVYISNQTSGGGITSEITGLELTASVNVSSVANRYGIYINDVVNTGGLITNNYGIFLAQHSAGATINWGIFSPNSKHYFGASTPFLGAGVVQVSYAVVPGANTEAGVVSSVTGSTSGAGGLMGGSFSALSSHAAGTLATVTGAFGQAQATGAGTTTSLYGLASGVASSNSAVVTTAYGLHSNVVTAAAGTITNAYGYYSACNAVVNTVAQRYGFYVNDSLAGQTGSLYGFYAGALSNGNVNFGFYSNLSTAAGFNFYAAGTSQNYFNGSTLIGIDAIGVPDPYSSSFYIADRKVAIMTLTNTTAAGSTQGCSVSLRSRGTNGGGVTKNNDAVGQIGFYGVDPAVGYTTFPGAVIYSQAAENFTALNQGMRIVFATAALGAQFASSALEIWPGGGLRLFNATAPTVAANEIGFGTQTSATIGANGAAAGLTANPVGYLKINVGGTMYQVPYYNV